MEAVRRAVVSGRWRLSEHAAYRASRRRIDAAKLRGALLVGEVVEDYADDPRGPSALVLGFVEEVPLHAVCGFDAEGHMIVITCYIPELPDWINPRTRG